MARDRNRFVLPLPPFSWLGLEEGLAQLGQEREGARQLGNGHCRSGYVTVSLLFSLGYSPKGNLL